MQHIVTKIRDTIKMDEKECSLSRKTNTFICCLKKVSKIHLFSICRGPNMVIFEILCPTVTLFWSTGAHITFQETDLVAFFYLGGMREPQNIHLFSESERHRSHDSETKLTVYPHTGGSTSEYVCQKKEWASGQATKWKKGLHPPTVDEYNHIRKVVPPGFSSSNLNSL